MTWTESIVAVGFLLLACLALSAFQCQTRGCSPISELYRASSKPDLPPGTLQATIDGQYADMWLEIGDTGVFTPTTGPGGETVVETGDGYVVNFLDTLATQGYVAIRMPHVPSGPESQLLPGNPYEPDAVRFSYYSPPTSAIRTTVAITVERRSDLEAIVENLYPSDSDSHWEVWWLPAGEEFPLPDQPFRLQADDWPPPLAMAFQIDFGAGAEAADCAGCPVEVLVYNGYVFIGPFPFELRYGDPALRDPLVAFGPHCGYESEALVGTIGQYITPTVPFTHIHCLENWDGVTRTFTVETASSQGWDYAYYARKVFFGAPLIPLGDLPFTVTVNPHGDYSPGCLGILAVYTPTIAVTDTLRETFSITATSTVSPEVEARSVSVALAPGYTPEESLPQPGHFIYLPLVQRSYP
ncbi:MAG: hypothetical protein JW900_14380 [Anaerolineae bacterium]|nr:hypothetical protein [Anaerolineae bacterium]